MLKWRFQRNLLLAFLLVGILAQAIAVGSTLYIVRNRQLDSAGRAAADLAGIGARVMNHGVSEASRAIARYTPPATGPALPPAPQSLVYGSRSSDRWYLLERSTNKVLFTNASTQLSTETIDQAVAKSASSSVAILASAVDNAILLAKRLRTGRDGVGHVVVAISPENALVSAISLLEPDKGTSLLLVDSTGEVLAANAALNIPSLPAGFAAKSYQTLRLAGRDRLVAAAWLPVSPPNERALSIVVLRDVDTVLQDYRSIWNSVLQVEILLLVLVISASLYLASRLAMSAGNKPFLYPDR